MGIIMDSNNLVNIDYLKIAAAIEFYKGAGYRYIETPWVVDQDIIDITCPQERFSLKTGDHTTALVGSAEQGFLQLLKDGKLWPYTKYMSAGPCFRVEDVIDELHQEQFFKIELFTTAPDAGHAHERFRETISDASKFMNTSETVDTADGIDLTIGGIEVGSYGHRHHDLVGHWAYGTGLAEPRYSQAVRKNR